uniref:Band_3_cyto domain-containing protein n=1 Tax=Globodera pallida TaxID=36090 RepID=A0A183BU66_GLOPA
MAIKPSLSHSLGLFQQVWMNLGPDDVASSAEINVNPIEINVFWHIPRSARNFFQVKVGIHFIKGARVFLLWKRALKSQLQHGELVALSGTVEFGGLPLFLLKDEAGVLICKALIFGVVPRDASSFSSAL